MPNQNDAGDAGDLPLGSYIILDDKVRRLTRHPTDFSLIRECEETKLQLSWLPTTYGARVEKLANRMSRIKVKDGGKLEVLMENVRQQSVAHHIYQIEGSLEERIITDRIILVLHEDNPKEILDILQRHRLLLEEKDETILTLKVTADSGSNPLKIANEIRLRNTVESCVPEMVFPIKRSNAAISMPELFGRQWYLTTDFIGPDEREVKQNASINIRPAWDKVQGNKKDGEVVIAVIDDGFDLRGHPAFRQTVIDPNVIDLVDGNDPAPENDFHGTCVAGLTSAKGDKMLGAAPDCALLPIRIEFNPGVLPDDVLAALAIANVHADVVNCSFEAGVTVDPSITANAMFMQKVKRMIANGGRRKNGLVIVFAAGNSNSPISLTEAQNKNGLNILQIDASTGVSFDQVPAHQRIHTGYTEIPGVIVVGAISALKRKAFYSNWGTEITITAPSGNRMVPLKESGRDVITANNRPSIGVHLQRGTAPPGYTDLFGGTSAAAPLVAGVVALMRTVNPDLTPADVCAILAEKADKDVDFTLDSSDVRLRGLIEGNFQDINRGFVNGKSILFGGGKVDAAAAVQAAIDRRAIEPAPAVEPH